MSTRPHRLRQARRAWRERSGVSRSRVAEEMRFDQGEAFVLDQRIEQRLQQIRDLLERPIGVLQDVGDVAPRRVAHAVDRARCELAARRSGRTQDPWR